MANSIAALKSVGKATAIMLFSNQINSFQSLIQKLDTGWARLIRTRLIRSSTKFEVALIFWQDSYHFMFKMHS